MIIGAINKLVTSSSSDDESDLDDLFDNRDEINRIPRVLSFVNDVIHQYNDEEFRQNFRLQRTTFNYLLYIMRNQLESPFGGFGKSPISAEKQLLLALWILGTPDSYRSATAKFGVANATAWNATYKVAKILCGFRHYFIKWPTINEAQQTADRIQEKWGFPGVIGAVDGTHIYISKPKRDSQAYLNRKGKHSIQLQVICNDKLEFIHCHVGMPGSVHDMRVFKYSGVQDMCTNNFFPENTHLLGDAAYTLQKYLMSQYIDNGHLTVEQVHFNTRLSKLRMMVERAIGLLKLRWRYFMDKSPMKRTDLILFYVLATCVLQNICLKTEDSFEYPIIIPEVINDFPEPLEVNEQQKQEGLIKRDGICHILQQNINI